MRLPRASFASLLSLSAASFAANQASCSFTTFSAPAGYSLAQVNGVSDDGTVVGQLEHNNSGAFVAFSRSAAGKFTLFAPPNSAFTWFNRRNLVGVNVGSYLDTAPTPHVHGLSQSGANYVVVNYPNAIHTWLYGINGAGAVVGNFSKGTAIKGFKLESGTYTVIRYPNALMTTPQAINASGLDHTPVAPGENRIFGEQLGPCRSSRAMAIVHIAMFDALNAVVRQLAQTEIAGARLSAVVA